MESTQRGDESLYNVPSADPQGAVFETIVEQKRLFDESLRVPTVDSSTSANDKYAKVINSQWKDWEQRHRPYMEKLFGSVGDPAVMQKAEGMVNSSFDQAEKNARTNQQIDFSRLGISQSPEEKAVSDRVHSLGLSSARTGAINNTRLHVQDRDNEILAGGLSSALKNPEVSQ